MSVMNFGIRFSTRKPLLPAFLAQEIANKILSIPHETLPRTVIDGTHHYALKSHFMIRRSPNLEDPREVGWTYVVGKDDPERDKLVDRIGPLAEHRGMKYPDQPLLLDPKMREYDWGEWIRKNCGSISANDEKPFYFLVVGGPDQIPFRFQSTLDISSAVGRICFDKIEDYQKYVSKIIDLEEKKLTTKREAVFYATDWGIDDPTFFSRMFLAEPLSQVVRDEGYTVKNLFAVDATKAKLKSTLITTKPALVFTASHGLADPNGPPTNQFAYNGAICCQDMRTSSSIKRCSFSARDVPIDSSFLEGSTFFEFSCFSYGTPMRSDFEYWIGNNALNTNVNDFISALPKKLLANPHGPIGFFGHVDTAWLHGFADPNHPYTLEKWHERIGPYKQAVEKIINGSSLGLVLQSMNMEFNLSNQLINSMYESFRFGRGRDLTDADRELLVENWIKRTDAQNYMLFGDPGTRVLVEGNQL